jgi:hypothetical protein
MEVSDTLILPQRSGEAETAEKEEIPDALLL